jgi:hypothetical protein
MREARLSIFAQGEQAFLGAPLESIAPIGDRGQCEGEVQSVTTIGDGDLRITGWAWDLNNHQPAEHVFSISSGNVIGFGATGEWRPAVRAVHHEMNTSWVGFTAYARKSSAPPVILYAMSGTNQACEIARIPPGAYSDVK